MAQTRKTAKTVPTAPKSGTRVTVISTGTNNTQLMFRPLEKLGHTVTLIVYDSMTHAEHEHLPDMIDASNPNWVLNVGAITHHHGAPVPSTAIYRRIGEKHRLVNMCCDGGEPEWWNQLIDYYENGRFSLQINVDGVRTGPISDRGMTTILPVDVDAYENVPWDERPIWCGFSGTMHGARMGDVFELVRRDQLVYRPRDLEDTRGDYRRFIQSCRIGLNFAATGGGTGGMHVKHRAAGELPAAGCLVLETKGSPLADWYTPGEHYLEYDDLDDIGRKIEWVRRNWDEAQTMSQRMRQRAIDEYSPAVFWSQVLARLGMGTALRPEPQPPYRAWTRPAGYVAAAGATEAPRAYIPPVLHVNGYAPRLVGTQGDVNFVAYGGQVHAVPHRLGSIHLDEIDLAHYGGIIKSYADLEAARAGT
jgi:hypothetical protein